MSEIISLRSFYRRLFRISCLVLGAVALLALPFVAVRGAEPVDSRLTVEVTGLRNERGNVIVSLFHGGEGFPDEGDKVFASRVLLAEGTKDATVRVTFDGLASGEYAVSLFHDENANGKLDTRWGIPTEGFGVSNNPRLRLGPPRYKDARFTLSTSERETTIVVALRYLSGRR